jgi:hypothetical protein
MSGVFLFPRFPSPQPGETSLKHRYTNKVEEKGKNFICIIK